MSRTRPPTAWTRWSIALTWAPIRWRLPTGAVTLGRELWRRAQERVLPEGTPYQELTGAFSSGLNKLAGAGRVMTRYIGGVSHRDHAGTDKATYEPVAAEKQRAALGSLVSTFFSPDSFKFKPEFVARLAKDRFDTWATRTSTWVRRWCAPRRVF